MRRLTLPLLCMAIALGGCQALIGSEPDNGSSGSGGTVPGAPGQDDPIAGGGGGAEPPKPIFDNAVREEPDPTVVDFRGQAVDHFTIGADGKTVVVYWWGGNTACFGLKEVMVEVQGGTPIITVLEGTRGDHVGMACTMEAVLKSALVTLDEPILADAADGDPAPGEPNLPADALRAKRVAGVVDPIAHAIAGYRLSADGLTLNAYFFGHVEECSGLADATATADGDGLLTVSIREGRLPEVEGCREIAVTKFVSFDLDEPLMVVGAFDSADRLTR